MVTTTKELLEHALELHEDERLELAAQLIESVRGDRSEHERAWIAEVRRRERELDDGTVAGVTWPDARKQILSS